MNASAPMFSRMGRDGTVAIDVVLDEEAAYLRERRKKAGVVGKSPEGEWIGLALSGGGIRSATFNLGLLQGLAEAEVLPLVDYLSTVSGGGYIGACLTSLLTDPAKGPPRESDTGTYFPLKAEAANRYVQHLRQASNFLAPRHGLISLDTWRLVGSYARGLILSLLIVLPALLASAILVRWVAAAVGFYLFPELDGMLGGLDGWSFFDRWRSLGRGGPAARGLLLMASFVGLAFLVYTVLSGFAWRRYRSIEKQRVLETALGFFLLAALLFLAGSVFVVDVQSAESLRSEVWLLIACLAATLILGYGFDWNHTSLHRFYRARLAEAYLTTRAVGVNGKVSPIRDDERLALADVGRGRRAPYHLIQTTLNLGGTRNPKWLGRRADFFLLSPLFCGSTMTGYVGTDRIDGGGMSLATAVAISGSAVSPQRGFGTSRTLAFLQTILNLRLGYWALNPRHWLATVRGDDYRGWRRWAVKVYAAALKFWPFYAVADLFGWASEGWSLVMLSDGGHHENLGLYALLERRCRYIVVSDAGADPGYAFEDLGNAIRKARIDLDVEVTDLDVRPLAPAAPSLFSEEHVSVGKIIYPALNPGDPPTDGVLVYAKASVAAHEPPDILHYKRSHPAFPHEPTSDQFFDEAQFESYRALGRHVAKDVAETFRASVAQLNP